MFFVNTLVIAPEHPPQVILTLKWYAGVVGVAVYVVVSLLPSSCPPQSPNGTAPPHAWQRALMIDDGAMHGDDGNRGREGETTKSPWCQALL